MTSRTPPGPTEQRPPIDDQVVEAINQIFALFRLNYHNQYYSAWSDAEQLKQVKRLWLEALEVYPTSIIFRAAQRAIETSDYLPTLKRMIDACGHFLGELGLPSPREAYLEACLASSPKSGVKWSHPAVYQAGKDSDWFFLANAPEARSWPVFREKYEHLAGRAARGEDLEGPEVTAVAPPDVTVPKVNELKTRLSRLRKEVGL